MSDRKEHIDRLHKQLNGWRAQLSRREQEVTNESEDSRRRFTDVSEELDRHFQRLEQEIERAKNMPEDAWTQTKETIDELWEKADKAMAGALSSEPAKSPNR